MNKTKSILSLAISIALTFTFSCSSESGDSGNESSSSVSSGGKGKSSSSSLKLSSSSEGTSSSSSEDEGGSSSSVGGGYKTVKIGNQIWMAENLNINVSGSKCYDGKSANCNKYGRLYNWKTAKSVCPSGWHLPSYEEWETLIETAGTKLKSANGFAALPGGFGYSDGDFSDAEDYGYWWTATEVDEDYAWLWNIDYDYEDVSSDYDDKTNLYSVRCVQNTQNVRSSSSGGSINSSSSVNKGDSSSSVDDGGSCPPGQRGKFNDDRDNKSYGWVKICGQTWMAENLNYAVEGSKCYGEGNNKVLYNIQQWVTLSPAEIQANCDKYGRLYDWETANSVCPSGWHLPSHEEWEKRTYSIGWETAGTKLKSTNGWESSDVPSGSDTYGFSALPGGAYADGYFFFAGYNGYWWTSTEYDATRAYNEILQYNGENVYYNHYHKSDLCSVRCVKD